MDKGAAHKPLLPGKKELTGKAEKPSGTEEERALSPRPRLRRLYNCEKDRGIGPVR